MLLNEIYSDILRHEQHVNAIGLTMHGTSNAEHEWYTSGAFLTADRAREEMRVYVAEPEGLKTTVINVRQMDEAQYVKTVRKYLIQLLRFTHGNMDKNLSARNFLNAAAEVAKKGPIRLIYTEEGPSFPDRRLGAIFVIYSGLAGS